MLKTILLLGALVILASGRICIAQTTAFDGKWDVTLSCPRSLDGAMPYSFDFPADVQNGVIHGDHGMSGQPGSLELDGTIDTDGTAKMKAHGLTGHSRYNLGHSEKGVAYSHWVSAHFDATKGAGHWDAARICDFTFTKD
jgi:hypothetical protein